MILAFNFSLHDFYIIIILLIKLFTLFILYDILIEKSKYFHIWLFPNYDWMQEKFGKGIKYLRDINEYIIQSAKEEDKKEVLEIIQKLKEYFND